MTSLIDKTKKKLQDIWKDISQDIEDALSFAEELLDVIIPILEEKINTVKGEIEKALNEKLDLFNKALTTIWKNITAVSVKIESIYTKLKEDIKSNLAKYGIDIEEIKDEITGVFEDVFSKLEEKITKIIEEIREYTKTQISSIQKQIDIIKIDTTSKISSVSKTVASLKSIITPGDLFFDLLVKTLDKVW